MKKNFIPLLLAFGLLANLSHGQGSMVFDQESSTDESFPVGGGRIQFYGTVGQSFVPSLPSVDFVRLKLYDIAPGNALGATTVVRLRANAITGTILGTTPGVTMADGFAGSINFIFANPIAVTFGQTYFLEVAVTSGDNWGFTALGNSYPSGSFYGGGFPATGNDLWFREGVVVPEPSILALLLGGASLFSVTRNRCVKSRAASRSASDCERRSW